MWWSFMLLALFLLPELSSWGCAQALQFAMWYFRWEAKEQLCQPPLSGSPLNKKQITDICCVWEKGGSVIFTNNKGCRKTNIFPQSQAQFPIVPGNPRGRERHNTALTTKDLTKNTQPNAATATFFFGFVCLFQFSGFLAFKESSHRQTSPWVPPSPVLAVGTLASRAFSGVYQTDFSITKVTLCQCVTLWVFIKKTLKWKPDNFLTLKK